MSADRKRSLAYKSFLALALAVLLYTVLDSVGRTGLLPQPVAAGLLVFVLMPTLGLGAMAGVAGTLLTLLVGRDPRLYALTVAAWALMVFWGRHDSMGASPYLMLLYPVGALLFSLRWLAENRTAKDDADPPESSQPAATSNDRQGPF
ncbi:MAG: hypothetical protein ACE5FN_00970 [Leptospirillia bacterium]